VTRSEAEEILDLKGAYSAGDVRKAYRLRAAKYHPDKGGDPWTFRLVRDAHDLLTSPETSSDTTPHGPESTSQRTSQPPTKDLPPLLSEVLSALADEGATKGLESIIGDRAGPAQSVIRGFLAFFGPPTKTKKKRRKKRK